MRTKRVICRRRRGPNDLVWLLEVVDKYTLPKVGELFDELQVGWMGLVIILVLLIGECDVHCDLVTLLDYGTVAGNHLSDVEMLNCGNGAEIFFGSGDQLVGGVRNFGLSPPDDNM